MWSHVYKKHSVFVKIMNQLSAFIYQICTGKSLITVIFLLMYHNSPHNLISVD